MADTGVQSGRKQVGSKTESWQEILYRKNDSSIIAYKEKRLKRRASVEDVVGSRFGTGCPLGGGGLLETVSNAISITLPQKLRHSFRSDSTSCGNR
jgi:hypothetical protein